MHPTIVPDAVYNSWEDLLYRAWTDNKLILTKDLKDSQLSEDYIGHRAIGVVYNPKYEMFGNYVENNIVNRYYAFIYFDETSAVHPLHIKPDGHQMPETYPWRT